MTCDGLEHRGKHDAWRVWRAVIVSVRTGVVRERQLRADGGCPLDESLLEAIGGCRVDLDRRPVIELPEVHGDAHAQVARRRHAALGEPVPQSGILAAVDAAGVGLLGCDLQVHRFSLHQSLP